MSKSKKNTIDPENIITNYGADSARLFILSDSPPEKDVQWSEEGIISSYKFIQKLWNLNAKVLEEIKKDHKDVEDKTLTRETNKFLKKITENLENFSYNKIVANLHEIYSFLSKEIQKSYSKNNLIENYRKILISIMPIIPHFSNECLKLLNTKDIKWPDYDVSFLKEEKINIVVQINGKKRGLLNLMPGLKEDELFKLISKDKSLEKYLDNQKIKRKIYIKDKLFNIII
jgi:leucyl-tRNA synthetase